MKLLPTLLLSLINSGIFCFAQTKTVTLKATSPLAYIREGNEAKSNWNLNSKINPDVYVMNKSPKPKQITFYTNNDSVSVKLKPAEKFDFVVILNEKDSCRIRFQSPLLKNYASLKPEIHDTIPFILSEYNNIIFKVTLNNKDTLDLKFDSGTSDFLLTNEVLDNRLKLNSQNGHTFQLGTQIWENQEVYPVAVSGQGTVGRFGWNLFDGKIIEIDYDKKLFIIHSKLPKPNKSYQKLDIEFTHTLFCIQGNLQINGHDYKGRFLFDNGYQRTVMMDKEIMKEQNYPKEHLPVLKKVIMKNGKGEEIPVLTVQNEKLYFGRFRLDKVPVQLLSTPNPARFKTHILGNEVLKRFNTILDFQHNVVYLKPNSLYNEPYSEG